MNRSCYKETEKLKIIETDKNNIYISLLLNGKNLHSTGIIGINGTFFDTPRPKKQESCWAIAINNGKPIGVNALWNVYNKPNVKRGTMVMYTDGEIEVVRVNNVNEFKKIPKWAIGGCMLLPGLNEKYECLTSDITRTAFRTGMAYKRNKVYLIVSKRPMRLIDFQLAVKELEPTAAIALDGGGSTEMFYQNGKGNPVYGHHTTRSLNNIVGIKEL